MKERVIVRPGRLIVIDGAGVPCEIPVKLPPKPKKRKRAHGANNVLR